MRQIFFAAMFVVTLTLASTCAAQDVWVERWESSNTDVYVMDDTITSGTSDSNRYFSVSLKQVKNGQLQKVFTRDFWQMPGDMWREHVKDHSVVVHPADKIFEFCMNKIGWSYQIKGNDPIVKFYY